MESYPVKKRSTLVRVPKAEAWWILLRIVYRKFSENQVNREAVDIHLAQL